MALLWQAKTSSGSAYTNMKTPSTYKHSLDDLDKDSFRSVVSGNLIRTIVSKKWTTLSMKYNHLTEAELYSILTVLNAYPIYVKIKDHPLYNGDKEMQMYCAKPSYEMLENRNYKLQFNLIQSKKAVGQ